VTARLAASGHPAVTGRHAKTLELTADPEITARASCVLGTSAGPLPGGLVRLRGRVRLELAVGDLVAVVDGEANPAYASASRLVVRRSDVLDPDTFLVNASAAAADLDRTLVGRLRDPASRLEVTATELGTPPPVLLLLAGPMPAGWDALATQIEHVIDLRAPTVAAGTADAVGPAGARGPAVRWHRRLPSGPGALAGARTVAVLVPDLTAAPPGVASILPGARVLTLPPAPGVDLLLAAGLAPAPVLHAGRLPTAARARPAFATLLGTAAAASVRLGPADDPLGALDDLRARLPEHVLLAPDPAVGWGVGVLEVPPAAPLDPSLPAGLRRAPAVAFARRGGAPAPLAVDPGELARVLRAAGVSGRSAAAVLTGLGLPRREAYRLAAQRPPPCGYPEGPPGPAR
jgi:hypothetical protein